MRVSETTATDILRQSHVMTRKEKPSKLAKLQYWKT